MVLASVIYLILFILPIKSAVVYIVIMFFGAVCSGFSQL